MRFGDRQGDAPGGEELDALQAESQGVHRVFGVVAVEGNQFRPVGVRPSVAGHGCLLGLQVAQEPDRCESGHEPACVATSSAPVSLRKTTSSSGTNSTSRTVGFLGRVPFVLLKPHRRSLAANTVGHAGQAGDELRRLQAQTHLIPVVLAADRGGVDTRAHLDPQDHAVFGDRASLLRRMRMPKADRQLGRASN